MDVGTTKAWAQALMVRHSSVASTAGLEAAIADTDRGPRLLVFAPDDVPGQEQFEGEIHEDDRHEPGRTLVGPLSAKNAAAMRSVFPWLTPGVLGFRTSAGFGDRLGLATPGHIRAMRAAGGEIAPIFAQQSIREMARTGRDAQGILDDAMWGVFSEGWRNGYGADADHLKTPEDIERCLAAGYTFYTFDPGDHVAVVPEDAVALRAAWDALPWAALETTPGDLRARYGEGIAFEGHAITLGDGALERAAVKYGHAVAHVARMYRHLVDAAGDRPFEVEVSVDETDEPTAHAEHLFIARELQRLGVEWVSLAPRYIGSFEKGVDYIGDVEAFRADFAVHAAIARAIGPYKLSLHSGSDKFSIYPAAVEEACGLVHLKTAGTSYLEALRALAQVDPAAFIEIYGFARERFEEDKASYHISATLDGAPVADDLSAGSLEEVLDQFDARQILHVTFGSVLTATDADGRSHFGDRLRATLDAHPEVYASMLERHFAKHLTPFSVGFGTHPAVDMPESSW